LGGAKPFASPNMMDLTDLDITFVHILYIVL
jgi:hypothetical protein